MNKYIYIYIYIYSRSSINKYKPCDYSGQYN